MQFKIRRWYFIIYAGLFIFLYYFISKDIPEDKEKRPHAIYITQKGRLGNYLFPFAAGWGVAKRTGRPLIIESGYDVLREYFPALKFQTVSTFKLLWIRLWNGQLQENVSYSYMTEWITNLQERDVILCCYMQSYKYFEPFEEELLHLLDYSPILKEHASRRYREILDNNAISQGTKFIAMHVRRGDIDNEKFHQLGKLTAPLSFMTKAKQYYKDKYKNVHFLIFSDSPKWCMDNLYANDSHIIEGAEPIQDMALMTMCDHMIMTVGTFGWWNAWRIHMKGGDVVYFNNSYDRTKPLGKMYIPENFMKPSWIPL